MEVFNKSLRAGSSSPYYEIRFSGRSRSAAIHGRRMVRRPVLSFPVWRDLAVYGITKVRPASRLLSQAEIL